MATVTDGASSRNAIVNKEHELKVRAVSTSETDHQVQEGEAFSINTATVSGTIDVGVDTPGVALLYVKNQDKAGMFATSVTISTTESTGGADDRVTIKQVGNFSAASSIITGGADGVAINRNVGKAAREFKGVIKTGGDAFTFTDGAAGTQVMDIFTQSKTFPLSVIIPVGGEFGITIDPPVGNTEMLVMISLNFHILEDLNGA